MTKSLSSDLTAKIIDFNIAGYNSARHELVERIKARDIAVRNYIAITLTICSAFAILQQFEIPQPYVNDIVYTIISLFGFGMSKTVSNHQVKIATIGYFIDCELVPELNKLNSSIPALDWESSKTNKETSRIPRRLHSAYYYIIFLTPQVGAILLNITKCIYNDHESANLHVFTLVALVLFTFSTCIILHYGNAKRAEYNRKRGHQ